MRLAIARIRSPRLARFRTVVDGFASRGGPCVKCRVLGVRECEAEGYYSVLPRDGAGSFLHPGLSTYILVRLAR